MADDKKTGEKAKTGPEQRRHRRLETHIEARVSLVGGDGTDSIPVVITNLGPEGAFVSGERVLPVQSQVSLVFQLDSYPREFDVRATILWERPTDGGKGMGMHFTRIPLFEKNVIIDYILRRYAEFQAGRGSD